MARRRPGPRPIAIRPALQGVAKEDRSAGLSMVSESLQAAVDQFLPEPLRELSAVAKLPPIAALSAHGFLAVNLHVTTGGATQVLSKRKQLGVLAFSVTLHRFNSRYAATRRSRPVMESITRPIQWVRRMSLWGAISHLYS